MELIIIIFSLWLISAILAYFDTKDFERKHRILFAVLGPLYLISKVLGHK